MYLSSLEIDVGAAAARLWLGNPDAVHRRLLWAFPADDHGRLLFRVEAERRAPAQPRVLAQSSQWADWPLAFRDFPIVIREQQKEVCPAFARGQVLRFVVRANPTARLSTRRPDGEEAADRLAGKRVGLLKEAEHREWLARKGEEGGFAPLSFVTRPAGQVSFWCERQLRSAQRGPGISRRQTHVSVDFEGYLEVTDPAGFEQTLRGGLGPAKAFGFGLLLLAPG